MSNACLADRISLYSLSRIVTYEPLHHKYRPQTFAELVGQDAIAQTLSSALRTGRIAPAYLFTGPRGTGKTSSARILAKSLNCLTSSAPTETPCGNCDVCQGIAKGATLDVIEIDAASNTGVDNIRDLIERAQFAPVQCRYKVYVIDECHMLSTAAFNSLLKTLEEPPDRVVFVLATTDPQRVLPTIISRCQKFDFRRIPLEAMTAHLRDIAQKETINIADDAVKMVAQIAQGGLRDAESLLDQLSLLTGEITVEKVWDLVGAVPENDLMALLEAIATEQAQTVLEIARHLMDRGREPLIVLQNLASFYRDFLIAKTAPKRPDLVALTPSTWEKLCQFAQNWETGLILAGQKHLQTSEAQIKNTTQPRLWLEVTLLGLLPTALRTQSSPSVAVSPASSQGTNQASLTAPKAEEPRNSSPRQSSINQAQLPLHSSTESAENSAPASSQIPAEEESLSPPSDRSPTEEESISQTPPPTPTQQQFNLEFTWQQVLAHTQPFTTEQLFRQHATLVSFDGHIAVIWMRTQPLLKAAKERVTNIEGAFQKVFKFQVTVRLTLANADTSPTSIKESPLPHRKASTTPPIHESTSSPDLTIPKNFPANEDDPEKKHPTPENNYSIPERREIETPTTSAWNKQVALREDKQAVIEAAQRLADIFSGEVLPWPKEEECLEVDTASSLDTDSDWIELPAELAIEEQKLEAQDSGYDLDTTGDDPNNPPF